MEFRYKLSNKAKKDLEEIYEYYEDQREHLGQEFVQETFQALGNLETKPEKNPADDDGVRKVKFKRFPYYLYYVIKAPIVLVIAIWHTARLPFSRKDRIEKD